jgi:hypothetical protein
VDEESKKIVSFRITKGNVHDTKKFGQLVKESAKRHYIDKVYVETKHMITTERTSIYWTT